MFSALYRASALAVEKEGSKQVVKAGGTAVVKQAEKEGAKQVAKAGGTEVAKQAEKKVAQEALEEVEEQGAKFVEKLSQNSKITKFFAKMTKGGADIAKKGIDLLSKAVGYLKDMRVVGSLFAKLEPVLVKIAASLEGFSAKMGNLALIEASAAKDGTKGMAMALTFAEGKTAKEVAEGYIIAEGDKIAKAEFELMSKCGFISEQRAAMLAAGKAAEKEALESGVHIIDQEFAEQITTKLLPNIEKFAAKEGLTKAEKEAAEAVMSYITQKMSPEALETSVNNLLKGPLRSSTGQLRGQAYKLTKKIIQNQLAQKMAVLETEIFRNMSTKATQAFERSLADALGSGGKLFISGGQEVAFRGIEKTAEGLVVKLIPKGGAGQNKIITRSLGKLLANPKAGGLIDTAMENAVKGLDNLMPEILGDPQVLNVMDEFIPIETATKEIAETIVGDVGEKTAKKMSGEIAETTTEAAIEGTAKSSETLVQGVKDAATNKEARITFFKMLTSSGDEQASLIKSFLDGVKASGAKLAPDASEKMAASIAKGKPAAKAALGKALGTQADDTYDYFSGKSSSASASSRGSKSRSGERRSPRDMYAAMHGGETLNETFLRKCLRKKSLAFLY